MTEKDSLVARLTVTEEMAELIEAANKAVRACMAAWAAGEPPHRVEAMIAAVEELEAVLAAPSGDPAQPVATKGGDALANAARELIAARFSTYKARNGREVGVEDSSGEKCWIVPFDEMAALEAALLGKPPQPVADAGDVALDPDMPAQQLRLHMGEMSAQEMRTARAAIRWANSHLSEQIASLIKERDEWREAHRKLQAEQYEHPWTVNQAAQERQKREAAESRLAELEQEAVKVVTPFAEATINCFDPPNDAAISPSGVHGLLFGHFRAARAFLDKHRRPS